MRSPTIWQIIITHWTQGRYGSLFSSLAILCRGWLVPTSSNLGFSFLLWEATLGSRWSTSPSNKDTGMKIVDMNCIQTIFVVLVATIISLPSRWMSNKCRVGIELLVCFYWRFMMSKHCQRQHFWYRDCMVIRMLFTQYTWAYCTVKCLVTTLAFTNMFGKLLTGIYLIRYLLVLMAVYFILLLLSNSENGFFVRLRD